MRYYIVMMRPGRLPVGMGRVRVLTVVFLLAPPPLHPELARPPDLAVPVTVPPPAAPPSDLPPSTTPEPAPATETSPAETIAVAITSYGRGCQRLGRGLLCGEQCGVC